MSRSAVLFRLDELRLNIFNLTAIFVFGVKSCYCMLKLTNTEDKISLFSFGAEKEASFSGELQ